MSAPRSRTARAGRDLRILRAAVFAAVCVVLAAAGHTLASCATAPLWTLAAGFLGTLAVVAPLAGRARSLPGIAAPLAVGQIALHTLFGLGQHGAAGMGASGPTSLASSTTATDAGLVERAARFMCGVGSSSITPAQAHQILTEAHLSSGAQAPGGAPHHPADALTAAGSASSLLPSTPMLLGHLLAALVAGWLLRRGDLALLRLIELSAHGVAEGALVRALRAALALVRALRAGLPAAPATGPRRSRAAERAPLAPRTVVLQHTVTRRGPPTAVLALAA
ncbi:hypothetical protein [Streptomyces sp. NPDC046985]|uniref:hypothetical protein n=1 Tax=Streptomyces sp. NPDC046985 TaxID=3155377 RepID=UPI0033D62BE1